MPNKGNSSIPLLKSHKWIERKQIQITNLNRKKYIKYKRERTEQQKHCKAMNNTKTTNRQTKVHKTQHRKLKTEQDAPNKASRSCIKYDT